MTMKNTLLTKNPTKPLRIGFEICFLFSCFLFLGLLFLQKQYFFGPGFPIGNPPHGPSFIVRHESNVSTLGTNKKHDRDNSQQYLNVESTKSVIQHEIQANQNDNNSDRQYLDVQSNSVIEDDIQVIWHDPTHQQICVQFKPAARCPHAEFIGRLSGPSLVILEWTESPNTSDGVRHCGSYSNGFLMKGDEMEYFVEIIILYCRHFGVGSILHQQQRRLEWLNVNFQKTCVENPQANRVTTLGASIRIAQENLYSKHDGDDSSGGRWVHLPSTEEALSSIRPLATRYQPQGCRRSNDKDAKTTTTTAHCQISTDTKRFADYTFEWNDQEQEKARKRHIEKLQWDISSTRQQVCGNDEDALKISDQKRNCVLQLGEMLRNNTLVPPRSHRPIQNSTSIVQKTLQQRVSKVCVVGYSHSYHIIHAMHQLNLGHHFVWAQARYPTDIDFHFVRDHMRHCDKFLIGVGQWPASQWGIQNHRSFFVWPEGKPVPFGVYQHEIFRLLDMFHNHFPKIRVYMRSIHYNPIMEESGKCLPGDWRTPTVMTAYSEIIREQVNNLNYKIRSQGSGDQKDPQIQFLDTRFITYPLWDSSYDWYHLADQVAKVEALYFASTILGSRDL